MAKKKIALMTYAIDGRLAKGTALVARKYVEELIKHKDRYDLTFIHYEKSDDPIYSHGIREIILPRLSVPWLNRRSIRQILFFLKTKEHFDIIHWFQPRLYPFFWLAPAEKLVVTVHGAGDLTKENPFNFMKSVFNFSIKSHINAISAGIVSSRFAAEDIMKHYGFKSEQVKVIFNGVDDSFFPRPASEIQAVRAKYGLPERYILGVARLNPNKNALASIKAFTAFVEREGDAVNDVCYVNIGARGTQEKEVRDFIESRKMADRVLLLDYVEQQDLPAVYSGAICLVFPLLNEGFGLPAIEGMSCGIPVVVSRTTAPEIQHDEALLVDPVNIEEISQAISILVTDKRRREQIRINGIECAKKYSWSKTGEGLRSLYEDLLTPIL